MLPYNKPPKDEEQQEGLNLTTQLLQNLRIKVVASFIVSLMVVYSFFGSIYRIPIQIDQMDKHLLEIETDNSVRDDKVIHMEKLLATKEVLFEEVLRTRTKVETLERLEASRAGMQQQMDRLEVVTKDLSRLLDNATIRLAELNANMSSLKETAHDTKRTLEDIKRKSP